ncbi:hypothetical protein CRUP_026229 [Coryphaenoides rupestris]|nr:hypothetical protein CRUP_026229 [Coryphaenoides rupestris]
MLMLLVRGSEPVEVRTSPLLVVSFNLPAMTEEEFFGDSLVRNLAAFLNVPSSMIRITKIVREDGGAAARRRRRRSTGGGLTVEVEIKKPPVQTTTNSTDGEEEEVEEEEESEEDEGEEAEHERGGGMRRWILARRRRRGGGGGEGRGERGGEKGSLANDLGQAAVSGNLSQSIGFNVSSLGIIPPPPPSSDPSWNQVATAEVTRDEPTVSFVASVASLLLVDEPVAGEYGNCVSVGVTTLRVTASLKNSSGAPASGLDGNTTILFQSCWANFTDLAVLNSGEDLRMAFTLNEWGAQSRAFEVKDTPTTSTPTNSTPTNSTATTMQTVPMNTTTWGGDGDGGDDDDDNDCIFCASSGLLPSWVAGVVCAILFLVTAQ